MFYTIWILSDDKLWTSKNRKDWNLVANNTDIFQTHNPNNSAYPFTFIKQLFCIHINGFNNFFLINKKCISTYRQTLHFHQPIHQLHTILHPLSLRPNSLPQPSTPAAQHYASVAETCMCGSARGTSSCCAVHDSVLVIIILLFASSFGNRSIDATH